MPPKWLATCFVHWNGASIAHAQPFSVGLNCALGAREMRPYLSELARLASSYVTCYPNAGLPNAFGEYDERPDDTGALLREFASAGFVNIVGGCCGTTPDHIRAIATAVADLPPRQRPAVSVTAGTSQYAGLETFTIRPDSIFTMIGERTNVTGSKRFARLITSGQYGEAAAVALDQVRGGANIVDVNMGCPVPKIAKHNAGCSLMREPDHAARVIAAFALRLGADQSFLR